MHYTVTVEELYKNGYKDIPTRGGVYIVKVPENFTVEITNNTTGIKEHKGKNLIYNKEYLEEKRLIMEYKNKNNNERPFADFKD